MDVFDFFYKLMRLYHRNAALSIKTLVLETEDGRKTLAHELIHVQQMMLH